MKQILNDCRSIVQFIERLDRLVIFYLPVKANEMRFSNSDRTVDRYYRLDVGSFKECPWVTITEHADSFTATVSGDEGRVFNSPEETFEALKVDCRERLADSGITPAF